MVTKTIDLQTTPTDIESLLAQLTPDTEIILMRGELPLARLIPVDQQETRISRRVAGLGKGSIIVSDDFDEPLPDEFWLGDEATDPLYWKD
ncbi:MAG: hypothetical protein KF716_32625 [Anaerolineae bacterium]|nr:hypothetical protein [Anaerolineae bacterium]